MKICFNNDLFLMANSPKDPKIGLVFNKKKGDVFQVEGITKDIISDLNNVQKDEKIFIEQYIKKYSLNSEDIKKFKDFLKEAKKEKIIKIFKK